jgi:2-dehydropantoate 2-reductase
MTIMILGAGVQGTLLGVRLARAGHSVTLIARGNRAAELRAGGAAVRNAITGRSDTMHLPVVEKLASNTRADLCLVVVRREQIEEVLPDLRAASAIKRTIFMVNHSNGSEHLFAALGRHRVVLGFPSAAGSIENGVDVYVEVSEQPMTIEKTAPEIAAILRSAGFRVELVTDMDSWLKRHAVFVTAVSAALYGKDGDPRLLSSDRKLIRILILAVREGWSALDCRGAAPPALPLRTIFCWLPLPL